jgi:hypothetical protein
MTFTTVEFIDRAGQIVASAQIVESDDLFRGKIDLTPMPASMRRTFEQYEELIKNQAFPLLAAIEDQVDQLGIKVVFSNSESVVEDLQIYPSTERVSFRLPRHVLPQWTPEEIMKQEG